ncbi:RNA polymerase sigma factor [Terrihabitans soli]|uniref:RNA polymerase sigma factor n=1 Tax=Terrihabitans soli TaxID=708113 RepID=A0A6S6QLF3_9HYPH|nr:RNA polymerase sigma factor [Terrihabitans soli]
MGLEPSLYSGPYMSVSEITAEQLSVRLQAVGRGDRVALSEVYEATSAKLMGVCLRILGERSEAEDVLQETYIAVWRRAGTYDPARAGAISWLVAVARNKALDRIRSGKIRRASAPLDDAAEIADPARSALAEVESADDKKALMNCLEELDGDQQASIRAAFLDGLTYEELAMRRNVPLGTMKSWIRRGLIKLRGCLER